MEITSKQNCNSGDDAHFVTDNLIVFADWVGTWTLGDLQSTDYPKKIIKMI